MPAAADRQRQATDVFCPVRGWWGSTRATMNEKKAMMKETIIYSPVTGILQHRRLDGVLQRAHLAGRLQQLLADQALAPAAG